MKYNKETLEKYIAAMEQIASNLGGEFYLDINASFVENWSSLTVNGDWPEAEILDEFHFQQNQYMEKNEMDHDVLALSFIKNGDYNEFINRDT